MHLGFALELSNVDLLNIDLLDTHLDLLDTDIPSKHFVCLQDVLKTSSRYVFKTSSRHVFSVTIFRLPRRLEDVFMYLARCLQRRFCKTQDVFMTSWKT